MRQLDGNDISQPPVPWVAYFNLRRRGFPERPFQEALFGHNDPVSWQSPIYTRFPCGKTRPVSEAAPWRHKLDKIAIRGQRAGFLVRKIGKNAPRIQPTFARHVSF